MAYSELIKSFGRIRDYMRSFYVYGFRHRGEYDEKSARGYDNERRRIESWLGDYMSFGQDADGRRVFLSVDSRAVPANPLYRAFRTKSFTDRDIMLHFQLLDILSESEGLPIFEIMEELSDRLNAFDEGDAPDESTVRKKLAEYEKLGLVTKMKRGRETVYARSAFPLKLETWREALAFFSEAAPLGVIGSFVQELLPETADFFRFKHHYILNALDSEILCALAEAMWETRLAELTTRAQRVTVLPLRFYISTQTGRQYVLAWSPWNRRFFFWRLDLIDSVKPGETVELTPELRERLRDFQRHCWGVSSGGGEKQRKKSWDFIFSDDAVCRPGGGSHRAAPAAGKALRPGRTARRDALALHHRRLGHAGDAALDTNLHRPHHRPSLRQPARERASSQRPRGHECPIRR